VLEIVFVLDRRQNAFFAELVEVNEALAAKLARLEHGAERMLEGWDEQRRDHGA